MAAGYRFDAMFLQELRDAVERRVREAADAEWVEHAYGVADSVRGAIEGDNTRPRRPAVDR